MRACVAFSFLAGAFAGVIAPLAIGHNATQTNDVYYAAKAEHLVEDLVAGNFAAVEGRFEGQMAKDLPEEKLSALWKEFTAEAGLFERIVTKTDHRSVIGWICGSINRVRQRRS
jgi:thiamine transporter ThiT